MGKVNDLTGLRINKILVIGRCEDYVSPKGKHYVQWLCRCDCGTEFKATPTNLHRKHTYGCQSCAHRHSGEKLHIQNEIKIDGDVAYLYTRKGDVVLLDAEDVTLVKDYCWWLNDGGYASASEHITGRNISMHRLILGVLDNPSVVVDHKNGNTCDNRKNNLRRCTMAENAYNKCIQPYNTSGITGVKWDSNRSKWMAVLCYKSKTIYLGRFDSKEEAITARHAAEDKYFGEYSCRKSRGIPTE